VTTTSAALFADEVQRYRDAQRLVLVHALEVQVQDLLLERVALHVTQQYALHVAGQGQVQDRGIEPVVLAGEPDVVVVQLDADRLEVATVDDGRYGAGTTQAAARTLALVFPALDLHFMCDCHFAVLPSVERTASQRFW